MMRKFLFLFITVSVFFTALFLGCGPFVPPDVQESAPAESSDPVDPERKDALALKHLQVTYISEETLACYVMSFISAGYKEQGNTSPGQSRAVSEQSASHAIAITKTTRLTVEVNPGFAETTADKRSARSVVGPGEIPFYIFTLENQNTGETGFALTCGDSRIGAVLAVAEQGEYDDADNPFLGIFYSCLEAYIENTISVYNGVTKADIENALNKINGGRNAGYPVPDLPVTDVGVIDDFDYVGEKNDGINNNDLCILETEWHQNSPYNDVIMEMGYEDPGSFKAYNFAQVKSSINAGCPVLADGSTTGTVILGITVSTPIGGHYWVIDGYRRMASTVNDNFAGIPITSYPIDYVHCNLGWSRVTDDTTGKKLTKNGWFISGVFNTDKIENIPLTDDNDTKLRSATEKGLYQYGLGILTGIRPK
jgi:hypothetical protein